MPSRLIDIPCDDIFRNDRLGLKPAIASHTSALLSRSPQAIAIDGQWGTGKTTFMALWAAYLRREGVKVVPFNPWKAFEADPFEALTRQILRQVNIPAGEQNSSHKRLVAFVRRYAPTIAQGAKLVLRLQPDLADLSEPIEAGFEFAGDASKTEGVETTESQIESPEAFASLLTAAAESWSERPIVVMVDELDRCSPEYAVEVLQLLEHVFHTDHVVFVVAVNQSELIHSIRSFYGKGFNAEGYLERFFDVTFALPASNRSQYIQGSLASLESLGTSAALFFEASGLSLREIDKSVEHLESVVEVAPEPPYGLIDLWIVRTLVPVEYRQFLSGEISDKALADAVFAKGNCGSLRTERQERSDWSARRLEVTLIIGSRLLPPGSVFSYMDSVDGFATNSELYRHHKAVGTNDGADGEVLSSYSQGVVEMLASLFTGMFFDQNFQSMRLAASLLDRESPPQ